VLRASYGELVGVDAVGGDFDFTNATEGEQELYEVFGRLFRGLFDNVPDGVGDWFVLTILSNKGQRDSTSEI
jgi:hypothetical protein